MTTYETTTGAERSRTHTWQPRPEMTPRILAMSGLEILRASLKGELPGASMMSTLGFRLTDAGEGFAVFEGDPGDHLLNPMGTVHGGFLAVFWGIKAVIRDRAAISREVEGGLIENVYRLQVMNTAEQARAFDLVVSGLPGIHVWGDAIIGAGARLVVDPRRA